ncbi:hypothetical protein [Hymenobacter norwichensis]|uniref:hypothetical protein n=1 Tax=Hymenobacter norwichensis TaxID=223903 RepID=UPI0003B52FFF|nr:hypothetical protein [Hymenobacter norwichensis]
MFKMITWPQYLGAVAVLLVLYYAYVGVVYYRAELLGLVAGKKGKAVAGDQAFNPGPTSLLNRGPLIPKAAAVVIPAAAAAAAIPAAPAVDTTGSDVATDNEEDEQEQAPGEETGTEASIEAPNEADQEAQPEASEETDEQPEPNKGNNFCNKENSFVENSVNFTDAESEQMSHGVQDGEQESAEEFEEDFTVGVAQLNNIFDRAADGELTQEQLVKEVPELENTDVLMAFYKTSTKSAQQLTAATYAHVAEPALN